MTEGPTGEAIGRRIRSVREAQLLSRADLAKRSGVSKAGIDHLERGLSARPRRRTIEKIASALGVEVETLLGDAGTELPKAEAPPSPTQPPLNGFEEERRSPLSPWAEHTKRIAERIRLHAEDPKSPAFRDPFAARFFVKEKDAEAADLFSLLYEQEMDRDPYGEELAAVWVQLVDPAFEDLAEALAKARERANDMGAGRTESELDRRRRRAAVAEQEQASPRIAARPESRGA